MDLASNNLQRLICHKTHQPKAILVLRKYLLNLGCVVEHCRSWPLWMCRDRPANVNISDYTFALEK